MALFSERHGYIKPNEVIIREQITEPIKNSIFNWIYSNFYRRHQWNDVEYNVWEFFFNRKKNEYIRFRAYNELGVILDYIDDDNVEWNKKIDLIEHILPLLKDSWNFSYEDIIEKLNSEFERHNFAYRIIDGRFEEITSKKEIESIEEALTNTVDGVRTHLQTALEKLSASQKEPDYRNSIKESISAVECLCRTITGENTLGKALNELERRGIFFNGVFKSGLEKLYAYTCHPDSGIRNALLDETNNPTGAEAIFMLVSCSAFINYITKKTEIR